MRILLRRRATAVAGSQFQATDPSVDLVNHKVTRGATCITLTGKEFTLLKLFLRCQGEMLPRSLIVSQVWDMNFGSSTSVVGVAVKRLHVKIDSNFKLKFT